MGALVTLVCPTCGNTVGAAKGSAGWCWNTGLSSHNKRKMKLLKELPRKGNDNEMSTEKSMS